MSKSYHSNQHAQNRSKTQTTALIYVIIHGFIFWAIARTMSVDYTTLGLVLFGLSSLASVIAGVAMWFWRRWGFNLYVISSIALGGVVLLETASIPMMFGVMLPMFIVILVFNPVLKNFK